MGYNLNLKSVEDCVCEEKEGRWMLGVPTQSGFYQNEQGSGW